MMSISPSLLWLLAFLTVVPSQFVWAVPLYKVEIYWVSINSYDEGFSTWPGDYGTSVILAEGDTVFNPSNEFEVELLEVDTSNQADAVVTVHLCGCTHAFSTTAIVGSGIYGQWTNILQCRSAECDYQYDHQLQIRVSEAGDDSSAAGSDDSGAALRVPLAAGTIAFATLSVLVAL